MCPRGRFQKGNGQGEGDWGGQLDGGGSSGGGSARSSWVFIFTSPPPAGF